MLDRKTDRSDATTQYQRALSRWENEGGAGPPSPLGTDSAGSLRVLAAATRASENHDSVLSVYGDISAAPIAIKRRSRHHPQSRPSR